MGLHPTDHRSRRELLAVARALGIHAASLADTQDEASRELLERLAGLASRLADEHAREATAAGVPAGPRAAAAGKALGRLRRCVRDPVLERNQALRLVVADTEGLAVLISYVGARCEALGDGAGAAFYASWERRIRRVLGSLRRAATAQAADPDGSVEPASGASAGRAAHRLAVLAGTVGEGLDRRGLGGRREPPAGQA